MALSAPQDLIGRHSYDPHHSSPAWEDVVLKTYEHQLKLTVARSALPSFLLQYWVLEGSYSFEVYNFSLDPSPIYQSYSLKGKVPLFLVMAHSTRCVGVSWTIQHLVCKAATWSSVHTFRLLSHWGRGGVR